MSKLLLYRVANFPVTPDVAEVRKKRRRRNQEAHCEKPALRLLLVPRHLPEADRHKKCRERRQNGERRETVAIDAPAWPHEPPRCAGGAKNENCGREEPDRKPGASQRLSWGKDQDCAPYRVIGFRAGLTASVASVARWTSSTVKPGAISSRTRPAGVT